MIRTVDAGLFAFGFIAGYFFIDIWKSAKLLLESLPPLVVFAAGALLLWRWRGSPIGLSGDAIMGFGIGLGVRGQVAPV